MTKNSQIKKINDNMTELQNHEENLNSLEEGVFASIAKDCGSEGSNTFGKMIYNQLSNCCSYPNKNDNRFISVSENMSGIAPKDQIEGMLAAQMIATHHAAMNCFRIAAKSEMIDNMNIAFNSANKLARTYAMQMEALNRYRGKGQQKITVEHVSINSGGQAIIGNVTKNET